MYKTLPPGKYFVTGTDTEIGKTFVTCHLLDTFAQQGHTTVGLKPVSAGCRKTEQGLRNEDAELLMQHMTEELPYVVVNPYAYDPPISPHLCAEQADQVLTPKELVTACQPGLNHAADYHLVEGAGGWMCPISDTDAICTFAYELGLPVIIVIGLKLGCLNHGIMTSMAVNQSGLKCAGWIANEIDPNMLCRDENIQFLEKFLPMPYLGMIPYQETTP